MFLVAAKIATPCPLLLVARAKSCESFQVFGTSFEYALREYLGWRDVAEASSQLGRPLVDCNEHFESEDYHTQETVVPWTWRIPSVSPRMRQ